MIQSILQYFKGFYKGNNDRELDIKYVGMTKYAPLLVVGGFFLGTILLFKFGPLDWQLENSYKLYSFLILCCIALVVGYFLAVKKVKSTEKVLKIDVERVFLIGAIIYLIIYFPTVYITTGKWFPDIYTGITNTGYAYRMSKLYNEINSPLILYVRMLLSPFMFSVIPITIYFMPKLSRRKKYLGIFIIFLNVSLGIAQGINKNVADFCAQMVLALLIMFFSNSGKKNVLKYRLKLIFLIFVICLMFFVYYANSMRNRVSTDIAISEGIVTFDEENKQISEEGLSEEVEQSENGLSEEVEQFENEFSEKVEKSENNSTEEIPQNEKEEVIEAAIQQYSLFSVAIEKENYFLSKVVPPQIMSIITYLSSYLSHGYYGLSLALEEDFSSTYGLGFSDFFRHNILKVVGLSEIEDDVVSKTYQGKISSKGWTVGAIWPSFFVYPASDISFVGTIFLVGLIGFLFGLSWKDAIITHNPFAISSFFGFSTMIFYFSANNQMFQGGDNFFGFSFVILCWLLTRFLHNKT